MWSTLALRGVHLSHEKSQGKAESGHVGLYWALALPEMASDNAVQMTIAIMTPGTSALPISL